MGTKSCKIHIDSNLPQDVLILILLRLPVKSLLRFKSVSKSWYVLLQNPSFITDHFNFNLCTNNESILFTRFDTTTQKFVSSLHSDRTLDPISCTHLKQPPWIEENDYGDHEPITLLGPINGIICVYIGYAFDLVLWNPATREYLNLPPHIKPKNFGIIFLEVGFGFDSKRNNEFKVVRIWECILRDEDDGDECTFIEVYSTSEDCWREIHPVLPSHNRRPSRYELPSELIPGTYNTYANGACHWLSSSWDSDEVDHGFTILSFDIADEVFHNVLLPSALEDLPYEHFQSLAVVNESIAVIGKFDVHVGIGQYFDIWVMKEYGIEESWTKLYRVCPFSEVNRYLGLLRNEGLFFENVNRRMVWYNAATKEENELQIHQVPRCMQIVCYVESLFPVKGENKAQFDIHVGDH